MLCPKSRIEPVFGGPWDLASKVIRLYGVSITVLSGLCRALRFEDLVSLLTTAIRLYPYAYSFYNPIATKSHDPLSMEPE